MVAENEQNAGSTSLASIPKITQHTVVRSYFKVVLLQVLLTLCLVIPLLFFGSKQAAASASIGGGIAVVGSLIYVRIALIASSISGSANAVLLAHYCAEIMKLLIITGLLAVVILLMKWVIVSWLLIAFAAALAGYWISLLLIK